MSTSGTVRVESATKASPVRGTDVAVHTLLVCGIVSSVLYAAMNIVIPMMWKGYSIPGQTVSELSAIDAPTRPVWISAVTVYTLLYAAFGCGVWASARDDRRLRLAGKLITAHGMLGLFWPPMHLRGAEFTVTDAMHIAFTVVTLLLMALTIGFGAAALGKRFRGYSVVTMVIFLVFGSLTGIDAPRIAKNLPTPFIGVWERVNIAAFMLWVIVFAGALLRKDRSRSRAINT